MAIYAISDLHLSFGIKSKPMNIFGGHWDNHEEKIVENWNNVVREDDVVLMAGDFSWATYLEESKEDFKFLDNLLGKKVILKGNHDYWWSTLKKMEDFLAENKFNTIKILYNNAIETSDYIIAGTRYWSQEENTDNEKIFNRECARARLSLEFAKSLNGKKPIIFMTHYPPDERIIKSVEDYNIKCWIYGHIHSNYDENIISIPNKKVYLTSCDYLNFIPIKIAD